MEEEEEGFMGSGNSANDAVGTTNEGGGAYYYYGGDPEVIKSLGLAHLLVLFWMKDPEVKVDEEEGLVYFELRNDPKGYQIIGCDPEETRQLLRYRSHVAASTPLRLYEYLSWKTKSKVEGVIERVYRRFAPEMSPNISYYSKDEYPHRDFALSCGILSSFCFLLVEIAFGHGVIEIVSTHNQDPGALRKFCESIKGFTWSFIFPSLNVQHDADPKINHLLNVVCQTLHLPLAQYGILKNSGYTLVHQFSYRDFENLAPWCQFKDAYFHEKSTIGQGLLAGKYRSHEAYFCRDIAALNITKYFLAHYAQKCGSIPCFTIYLRDLPPLHNKYVLEFFLPPREIANGYPHTLLNSIWAEIKECLPNYMFHSRKQLGKVLSVKVIKLKEPDSFEIGQHNNSLPHHEGSIQRSSLNSYEVGEMSSRIPIEAPQHEKSKERFEIEENTGAVERVSEPVEEATIEDAGYARVLDAVNESEESLNKCIEPQSLASQPRRSEEIFRDEGYPVAPGRDNFVEVSSDEDVEYDVIPASKRLKKSKIPFTVENI